MIVSDIDTMADDYYAGEYEGNENALKIFGDDDFMLFLLYADQIKQTVI